MMIGKYNSLDWLNVTAPPGTALNSSYEPRDALLTISGVSQTKYIMEPTGARTLMITFFKPVFVEYVSFNVMNYNLHTDLNISIDGDTTMVSVTF